MIEARYDEIFTTVKEELQRSHYDSLIPAGIVLTGGAAQIEGCRYLAESIFNKQVRLAENKRVNGIDNLVYDLYQRSYRQERPLVDPTQRQSY